jgi:hypothetical protein
LTADDSGLVVLFSVAEDQVGDGVGGALIHRRQHMLIQVGGDRRAGVAEPFGDDLERLAGG